VRGKGQEARLSTSSPAVDFATRKCESLIASTNWRSTGGALFDDRPGMTQSIICQRAFEFAVRIVKLCENMSRHGMAAHHIAKQLIRCGTSIGANAEEAQEGQSKADYVAKMCVSSNRWFRE
jgi:hypothetical protein